MAFSTVVSTRFLDELKRRSAEFRGKTVAARIQVPPSLYFWYWLEFGTALRGEDPTRQHTYPIDPVNKKALHWTNPGGDSHFAFHVDHPGIRPHLIVRNVLESIREAAGLTLSEIIPNSGFSVAAIREGLLSNIMPNAKSQIVESMALKAPGVRSDGKLEGRSASEVFASEAKIVERETGE